MKQKLHFPVRIPFVEELGFELWRFGDGQAELQVDLNDSHLNSWEVAHGGVLMTLLDVAMAMAARSAAIPNDSTRSAAIPSDSARSAAMPNESVRSANQHAPDGGPGVATIEMKTSFMRPAEGRLRAEGLLLDKTTTLAFTEGRVFDAAGRLCAHATGTFKYLRGLPTSGRRAKTLQRADAAHEETPGRPKLPLPPQGA